MVVCHCLALNDAAIAAVAADGSITVEQVVDACGAGGRCGGCRPLIAEVLVQVGSTDGAAVGSPA